MAQYLTPIVRMLTAALTLAVLGLLEPAVAAPGPLFALAGEEEAKEEGKGKPETPAPAKAAKKSKKKEGAEPAAPAPEPEGESSPAAEKPAEEDTAAKKTPGEGTTTSPAAKLKKKPTVDEKYVLDNLQAYLSPTKMEVLPDGRVKLLFEFGPHKPEHESIFSPKIAKESNSTFRWTLRGEYSGYWGVGARSTEDGGYYYGGLRLGQQGQAHLNAWFTDDLEAEIHFAQGSSASAQQTIALVFTNGSRKSIGSNWGTQCTVFQAGRLKNGKGTVETVNVDTGTKIKLVLRNGIFEAHRDGRQKQTMEYSAKDFASGQVGFIWGGRLAGFIYKLEVTGRLDAKKMADFLKKTRR